MRIAVIEPHYDDCWLNMGGLMLSNLRHEYRVITISKDDDSLDVNREKVDRQMRGAGAETVAELFAMMNHLAYPSTCLERVREATLGCEAVFVPLGLSHPMHIVLRDWGFDQPTFRYPEYPYDQFPTEAATVTDLTRGMRALTYDISKVTEEKERIFRKVYTSEVFILELPACPKRLAELDTEIFYSRNDREEALWSALA